MRQTSSYAIKNIQEYDKVNNNNENITVTDQIRNSSNSRCKVIVHCFTITERRKRII